MDANVVVRGEGTFKPATRSCVSALYLVAAGGENVPGPRTDLLAPAGGAPDPAVGAELCVEVGGKGAFVTGGKIRFDVSNFAHAGNDRADVRVIQNEAESHFRHRGTGRHKRFERIGVFDTGLEIFRNEISAAPIALGPFGIERERSGERTFMEWNARDDGNIFFAASGEEFVFRILVEDVVDDLNGVNQARANCANAIFRLPAVLADADSANFSGAAKHFDGPLRAWVVEPAVFPRVILNEVESFAAETFEAFVDVFQHVFGRVAVVERKVAL